MNRTLASLAALLLCCATLVHAEERALNKAAIIGAPVAEVWKAWTTSEGIQSFFAPEAFVEAKPMGKFWIHMNPYAAPGLKGADDMVVLAVQEGKMISFTWNAPPHMPEVRGQRTYVTVRMKALNEKETEVTLFHGGWGDGGQWDDAYKYFDTAWGKVLSNMQKRFIEQKPIDWTPFLERLKAQAQKK